MLRLIHSRLTCLSRHLKETKERQQKIAELHDYMYQGSLFMKGQFMIIALMIPFVFFLILALVPLLFLALIGKASVIIWLVLAVIMTASFICLTGYKII